MSDKVCGVHATDGVRHHDCPYCHQIEIAEKDAEIERLRAANEVFSVTLDGLYEQLAECRRLLREACELYRDKNYFGDDLVWSEIWYRAARKAAGGDDE